MENGNAGPCASLGLVGQDCGEAAAPEQDTCDQVKSQCNFRTGRRQQGSSLFTTCQTDLVDTGGLLTSGYLPFHPTENSGTIKCAFGGSQVRSIIQ